jgi:hypothetical protein
MTNPILLSLCVAAEGFLLSCLFHFGEELKRMSRRESDVGQWITLANANAMSQFCESVLLTVQSEVAWNVVSFRMDGSKSRIGKCKSADGQGLRAA